MKLFEVNTNFKMLGFYGISRRYYVIAENEDEVLNKVIVNIRNKKLKKLVSYSIEEVKTDGLVF